MPQPQPAVFAEGTHAHWFLHYRLVEGADLDGVRSAIADTRGEAAGITPTDAVNLAVGFGDELLGRLAPADRPEGLRPFRQVGEEPGPVAVATQEDLFFWVHSNRVDRNFDVARQARRALDGLATLARETVSWVYHDNRDLTGFIDGTANPPVEEARELAVVGDGPGAGGSYAITQRYIHDLDAFHALPVPAQETTFGRTKPDSIELDDKPVDAHISRVEIENEDGEEIEIYRRSVPYGNSEEFGLYFIGFTDDLDTFDRMLANMYGTSGDGVHDRLMDFTRPVSGAYYFLPPVEVMNEIAPAPDRED
jgi:putative iron-dependent peroxidase